MRENRPDPTFSMRRFIFLLLLVILLGFSYHRWSLLREANDGRRVAEKFTPAQTPPPAQAGLLSPQLPAQAPPGLQVPQLPASHLAPQLPAPQS